MAAAPELLATLQELLKDYSTSDFDVVGVSYTLIDKAKATISKALGKKY